MITGIFYALIALVYLDYSTEIRADDLACFEQQCMAIKSS
jgi:hypothetical protein